MRNYIVYMLLCRDGKNCRRSFYTGITNNFDRRWIDHIDGRGGRYTRSHKPQAMVTIISGLTRSQALREEARVKKLSSDMKRIVFSSAKGPHRYLEAE